MRKYVLKSLGISIIKKTYAPPPPPRLCYQKQDFSVVRVGPSVICKSVALLNVNLGMLELSHAYMKNNQRYIDACVKCRSVNKYISTSISSQAL